MIFNNCGKSLNNYSFRYSADELENIKSYKYLGLIMSPHGNFNLAGEELKKVALKALYKYYEKRWETTSEKNIIKLTMKLFDALMSPILFYASELSKYMYGGLIAMDNWKRIEQNKFKINL